MSEALPLQEFTALASEQTLEALAERLRERNLEVVIVDDGAEARNEVMARLPAGAEVGSAKSKTLDDIGVFDAVHGAGGYDAIRNRYMKMDRESEGDAIRKLMASPDFEVGSVHAVTADGVLVIASASSSQLGPYASGAGKLILVVGSQKLVPDLETALRRIRDHVLPYEDDLVMSRMGVHTIIAKVLLIEREWDAARTTVILVREPVGV